VRRLAIFVPYFETGGVERMMVNLARGIVATTDVAVDLLVCERQSIYLNDLPAAVRIVEIGSCRRKTISAFLVAYLQQTRPDVLLSSKSECDQMAGWAKQRAGDRSRWFIRIVVNVSQQQGSRNWFKRSRALRQLRRTCQRADGIIAVSGGVADDIAAITGISREKIHVAPNPVITAELGQLARRPPDHPWLTDKACPVIVGAGRLGRQKNFALLIRAFALVRRQRPVRLIILGEGRRHQKLLGLAAELGVAADVSLPGFNDNPYTCINNADVFVLSSRWEGSPNILTEAMALGTPVVATDCPSGPAELLHGGRVAPLVAMDDADGMATAIIAMLDAPPTAETLSAAVSRYTVENSSALYLAILGLTGKGPGDSGTTG
jgi:glycosyltransferase involved in cell wall biosynthesis